MRYRPLLTLFLALLALAGTSWAKDVFTSTPRATSDSVLYTTPWASDAGVVTPTPVAPQGVTKLEATACATDGGSPCTNSGTAAMVLNVNANRTDGLLTNVGSTNFYILDGDAGTVSSSNYTSFLQPGQALGLDSPGGVWTGQVFMFADNDGGILAVKAGTK